MAMYLEALKQATVEGASTSSLRTEMKMKHSTDTKVCKRDTPRPTRRQRFCAVSYLAPTPEHSELPFFGVKLTQSLDSLLYPAGQATPHSSMSP